MTPRRSTAPGRLAGAAPWALLLLLPLLATPSGTLAQDSSEGAPFLLLPVGAHAVALGRAVTAVSGEESAFWNPAGLASLESSRLVLLRSDLAVGTSTAASVLLARPGVGTLGASYLVLDVGDQEYRDAEDNPVGSGSVRNHLAVLSAALRLLPGVDAGVSLKAIQYRQTCRGLCADAGTSAGSFAVDAGLQVTPRPGGPLRLGAMVANLGPDFQYENASQADPLPTRVRVAAAYDLLRHVGWRDLEGWLTLEVQDRLRTPGDPSLYVGSELVAGGADALFLRAGYATEADQPGGASVGLGLRFERFEIAVAKSSAASIQPMESDLLNVTFSMGL